MRQGCVLTLLATFILIVAVFVGVSFDDSDAATSTEGTLGTNIHYDIDISSKSLTFSCTTGAGSGDEVRMQGISLKPEGTEVVKDDDGNPKKDSNGNNITRNVSEVTLYTLIKAASEIDIDGYSVVVKDFTYLPSFSFYRSSISSYYSASVSSYGEFAFSQCGKLISVMLGEGVTSFPNNLFSSATKLTTVCYVGDASHPGEVYLPKFTIVSLAAFSNCQSIEKVTIGSKETPVTGLSGSAFNGCISLKYFNSSEAGCVNLDGITTLNAYAFKDCSLVEKVINLASSPSLTDLNRDVFNGCTSLISFNSDIPGYIDLSSFDSYGIACFRGIASNTDKDLTVNLKDVKSVENSCFALSNVSEVINSKLTSLPLAVFSGCKKLVSFKNVDSESSDVAFIDLKSITSMGSSAFSGCSSITKVLNSNITVLPNYAFSDCTKLVSYNSENEIDLEGVTSVGNYSFSNCSSIAAVQLPPGVTTIGDHAFYNDSVLLRFNSSSTGECVLPYGLSEIKYSAFERCTRLVTYHIPSTMKSIGLNALSSSSSVTFFFHNISNIAFTDRIVSERTNVVIHSDLNDSAFESKQKWFGSDVSRITYKQESSATLHMNVVAQSGLYNLSGSVENKQSSWSDSAVIDNGKIVLPYLIDSNSKWLKSMFGVGPDTLTAKDGYTGGEILQINKDSGDAAYSGDAITIHVQRADVAHVNHIYMHNGLTDKDTNTEGWSAPSSMCHIIDKYHIEVDYGNYTDAGSLGTMGADWIYGQLFSLDVFTSDDATNQYYTGIDNQNRIYLTDKDGNRRTSVDQKDVGLLSQVITVGYWETGFIPTADSYTYTIYWYDSDGSRSTITWTRSSGQALGEDSNGLPVLEPTPSDMGFNSTKAGYDGVTAWYDSAVGGSVYNGDTPVYRDMSFYLRFTTPTQFRISITFSGESLTSQTVQPESLNPKGPYSFTIYYTDYTLGDKVYSAGTIIWTDVNGSTNSYTPVVTGYSFSSYTLSSDITVVGLDGGDPISYNATTVQFVEGGSDVVSNVHLQLNLSPRTFAVQYYQQYGESAEPINADYQFENDLRTVAYSQIRNGLLVHLPTEIESGYSMYSVKIRGSSERSLGFTDNGVILNTNYFDADDKLSVIFIYERGWTLNIDYDNYTAVDTRTSTHYSNIIKVSDVLATIVRSDSVKKTGYTFAGWSIDGDATSHVYTGNTLSISYRNLLYSAGLIDSEGNTIGTSNTVTIYAVWTANSYPIEFRGVTWEDKTGILTTSWTWPQEYTADTKFYTDQEKGYGGDIPTMPGYTFSGWKVYIKDDSSTSSVSSVSRDGKYWITLTPTFLNGYNGTDTIFAEPAWTPNTYHVVYGLGDAQGEIYLQDGDYTLGDKVSIPASNQYLADKDYSVFLGWSVTGDKTTTYASGATFVITVSSGIASAADLNTSTGQRVINVDMVWAAGRYPIVFNLNGGIGDTPASFTGSYLDPISSWPDSSGFYRTGYSFSGWAFGTSDSDDVYTPTDMRISREMIQNADTEKDNKITMYAKWAPQRYYIDYDLKGGASGLVAPTTIYSGVEFSISTPSKTGYYFAGWSPSDLGSGAKYRLGDSLVAWKDEEVMSASAYVDLTYKTEGHVTLIATWSDIQYTVSFDLNGGEGATPDSQFPLSVSDPFSVPASTGTRSGYSFGGWSIDGITPMRTYTVTNAMAATADEANVITLKAVWSPNIYTIHVVESDDNGYDLTATYGESIDLSTPSRTFYTFNGWSIPAGQTRSSDAKYSTSGGLWVSWPTGTDVVNTRYVMDLATSGTITVEADWTAIAYYIEYDLNGGSGSTSNASSTIHASDTRISFPSSVSRSGYDLKGWSINGTTVLENTDIRTMVSNADATGTVTLIAVWTPTNYTIHVVEVSGSVEYNVPAVYGESVSLGIPTRSSYTFTGWRITPASGETRSDDARYGTSGTGQWIPWAANAVANAGYVIDISLTDTITVQAVWEAKAIHIEYDLNGGTGSTSSAASTVRITDPSVNLPTSSQVSRPGYSLRGWSVNGSTLLAATDVRTMVANADSNDIVTLKALWNSNSYIIHVTETDTLSYDVTAVYGESVYLGTPTRTYYTFSGWSIPVGQSRSDDARYSVSGGSLWIPWPNGASAVNAGYVMDLATAGTINVQATWTAVTYYIDYDLSGGTGSTGRASTTVRITDSSVTFPASSAVTRGGYTLGGWSVNGVTVLRSTDVPTIVRAVDTNDTVTLKAVWNSNSYTVHVVESDSVEYDVSAVYDESVDLGIPTRAYYTFAGWSIPANQSRSADARYSVSGDGWIPWPSGTSAVNAGYAIDLAYSGTITVQATWNADTYHIEYDLVGGKGSTDGASSTVKVTDASVTFPGDSVSRDGYTLRGWSVNGATVLEPTEVRTIVGAADDTGIVKLIAVWGSNTYTVHVVEVPDSIEYDVSAVYGESVSLGIPTRAYYTFAGWNIVPSTDEIQSGDARYSASGSGQWIPWPTDGTYVNAGYVLDLALSETIRVEAVWNAKSIYIEYDYNGGRGDTDGASATVRITDEKVTLPNATQVTRQGYALNGWSLNGTVVLSDTDVSSIVRGADENDTVTLHAVWSTLDYTIRYRTLETDDYVTVSATFDAALNLGTPTRQWYVFEGWLSSDVSTDTARYSQDGTNWMPWPTAEGSTVNGGYVMNLTSVSGGTVTLDAVWTAQDIYIEYNLNGGTGSTEQASSSVRITDERMTLPTAGQVSREGYSLAGWSLNGVTTIGEADVQTVVRASGSDGTVTLIAMWATVDYSVRYRALETDEYITVSATFDVPLNIGMPTRQGYTFAGWVSSDVSSGAARYSSDGSFWIPWPSQGIAARGGYVIDLTGTEGGTVTLDATWDLLMVNVDYDLNGGTGEVSGGSAQVHLGMEDFEFAQPGTAHRDGYAFSGWSLDRETVLDGFTDRMVLEADSNNRITLYAVWSANAYYIEYRSTEDAVYVRTQVYYDVSVEIGTPERVGYSFLGWSSTDVDTDQSRFSTNDVIWQEWPSEGYAYGGYVKNLSVEASGVVHLTAVWQKTVYTVTYDANGSSGAPPVDSATYMLDDPFTLASVSSLQGTNGKRIATGWALDQTATTGITVSSFVASLAEAADSFNNVTLYAVWIEGKYSVMVDIGDAKPSIVPTGWTLNSDGLYQREADYGSLTKDVLSDWDDTSFDWEGHKFTAWRYDISSVITDVTVTADFDEVHQWYLYAFVGVIIVIAIIAFAVTRMERW